MDDIRTLRQNRGLRLRDLAYLANVDQSELSKCERGLALPNDDFFDAIAKALRVDTLRIKDAHLKLVNNVIPGEGYTTAKPKQRTILYRQQPISTSKVPILDIFCGTGGFSHGFNQTNFFEVISGVDLLEDRAQTFRKNHKSANVLVDDINDISISQLYDLGPRPEVIIGGPPCQGFSSIRPFRNLTLTDPRNNLFELFALIVHHFKPKWFVLENVVGLLTHDKGQTIKHIIQLFEQIGYKTDWKILNTAFYGLPQRRERLLIIGNNKNKTFYWPDPTHYFEGRSMAGKTWGQTVNNLPLFQLDLAPAITVMEAIHDLPEIGSGEKSTSYRSDVEMTNYERMMRGECQELTLHESTRHSGHMLEIIRKSGSNRYALPAGMTTSGFSSSYSRLEPDAPSVTLTVNFVHPASNKCIHPYQDRALTPREGARLQGFSDDYIFVGSRAQIVKQIGNAVPPLLGKIIAETLLKHF